MFGLQHHYEPPTIDHAVDEVALDGAMLKSILRLYGLKELDLDNTSERIMAPSLVLLDSTYLLEHSIFDQLR